MSSIEDRLNAVIRSGGTSASAPAQTAKKAASNSISERLDKVIASGKGQPSVYQAPAASAAKASTSKNQWVSTGGGRKSTTGAGKQQGFVADPTRAQNASSRVKNIATGATKSAGSAYANLGGVLATRAPGIPCKTTMTR